MTTRPTSPRQGLRTVALGGLVAACLAFGVAACSSDTERLADRSGTDGTPAAQSVEAPLNADPTSGQDPADATGSAAPGDPLVTGADTETNMTSLSDLPDPSATAVSTSGPADPAGNVDEIVPAVDETFAPPVGLTDTADFGGQVTARFTSVEAVQAAARLPGEVSGPAVRVSIEIDNGSADTIGVDTVTVTMTDAAGNPASSITADDATPFNGVVLPGEAANGTYLFTVPADQRNPVTVTVSYSTAAPTLVFTGQVAGG
jgi:hypothetical protein